MPRTFHTSSARQKASWATSSASARLHAEDARERGDHTAGLAPEEMLVEIHRERLQGQGSHRSNLHRSAALDDRQPVESSTACVRSRASMTMKPRTRSLASAYEAVGDHLLLARRPCRWARAAGPVLQMSIRFQFAYPCQPRLQALRARSGVPMASRCSTSVARKERRTRSSADLLASTTFEPAAAGHVSSPSLSSSSAAIRLRWGAPRQPSRPAPDSSCASCSQSVMGASTSSRCLI